MATVKKTEPETPELETVETEDAIVSATSEVIALPNKYATEFYKDSGIPYCLTCGEVLLADLSGRPICAESRPECPRNGDS